MESSDANGHGTVSRRHRSFDLLSLGSITGPCQEEDKMIISNSFLLNIFIIYLVWPVGV